MFCSNCGKEVLDGDSFCATCGAKVDTVNVNNQATPPSTPQKMEDKGINKVGKFITGALSFIAFIAMIGGFLGIFDNNPVPFLIFIGVVFVFNLLEEKLPKLPTIVVAILEIVTLMICFGLAGEATAVASVKGGTPEGYPTITYERAFDYYFSNPVWKSVGADEDGNEVVKFTGTCTYLDKDAVAEVKFTIYKEQERFAVTSVKINGDDMGLLGNALVLDVFEEYESEHK